MRGAAMKIGQVLSTVEFTAIPESEREEFKATLASLRDDVPPLPFKAIEKLMKEELDMPVSQAFAEFEPEAFAAASIGQVHRATTKDGRQVAVKVQYPGIAEAVETDLRNMQMLFPLIRRLAPGLDVNALAGELRERISDELDYEVEAQHHRAMERGWRGHPFVFIPPVDTQLSRRRILVTEFMAGRRFDVVKALPDAERDRFGEIVFRFFFGTLNHLRRAAGDPHPGNYLYLEDGRVGFLDFGLMRVVDADYLAGERRLAQAIMRDDAVAVKDGLATLGYLPNPDEFEPEGAARPAPDGGHVVPGAGVPPAHLGRHRRGHRGGLIAALAVLRADAPADDPAAGVAHPAHGRARVRDARRRPRGRRLARPRHGVLGGRHRPHPPWESRTPHSGDR